MLRPEGAVVVERGDAARRASRNWAENYLVRRTLDLSAPLTTHLSLEWSVVNTDDNTLLTARQRWIMLISVGWDAIESAGSGLRGSAHTTEPWSSKLRTPVACEGRWP